MHIGNIAEHFFGKKKRICRVFQTVRTTFTLLSTLLLTENYKPSMPHRLTNLAVSNKSLHAFPKRASEETSCVPGIKPILTPVRISRLSAAIYHKQ
jgi:hypothetical protein